MLEDPKVVAHVAKVTAAAIRNERSRIVGAIKAVEAPTEATAARWHKSTIKAITAAIKA